MSIHIGVDATQRGSAELTFLNEDWAEPPDAMNALAWANAIFVEWGLKRADWVIGSGFAMKRADWVIVATGEYVLHGLYEDDLGCLHAFVAVQLG